ncbi:cysteine dioxygenase family protein [Actinosynnema sp. NPDC050801]|uniref:cysteine dioxygenase n=1 Tax=unclassified Actinosynnema TaxID=2637065 RepID=UPI0033DC4BFD
MTPDELIGEVAKVHADSGRIPRDAVLARLATALRDFAGDEENQRLVGKLVPSTNYARLLLNSLDDPFQIVLVLWAPGRGSPVHDHDGTVGMVSAVFGRTREIKYEILHQHGSEVALAPSGDMLIVPGCTTPIYPEDDMQLHLMVNETSEWAATVHIYMTAIHSYRTYAQQSDKLYRSTAIDLWFDQINVARDLQGRRRGANLLPTT